MSKNKINELRPLAQKLMSNNIGDSIKQFLDEMSMNDPDYDALSPDKLKKLEAAYYEYLAVGTKIAQLQEDIIYECF